MVRRIAVIGAGAAGLNALKQLMSRPSVFEAVGFEQSSHVGGTWTYNDRVGSDDNGVKIHSSMYFNLR